MNQSPYSNMGFFFTVPSEQTEDVSFSRRVGEGGGEDKRWKGALLIFIPDDNFCNTFAHILFGVFKITVLQYH